MYGTGVVAADQTDRCTVYVCDSIPRGMFAGVLLDRRAVTA